MAAWFLVFRVHFSAKYCLWCFTVRRSGGSVRTIFRLPQTSSRPQHSATYVMCHGDQHVWAKFQVGLTKSDSEFNIFRVVRISDNLVIIWLKFSIFEIFPFPASRWQFFSTYHNFRVVLPSLSLSSAVLTWLPYVQVLFGGYSSWWSYLFWT